MQVRVLDLAPGKRASNGKVPTIFAYTALEGDRKEQSLLIWDEEMLRDISVGDVVDLSTEQRGKYTNATGIKLISKNANPVPTTTRRILPDAPPDPDYQRKKHPDEQYAIAKAVALGQAATLIAAQKVKLEDVSHLTIALANDFVDFLMGPGEPEKMPEVPS